jgi:uncharacterized repeat protein (TIGR03803 family)
MVTPTGAFYGTSASGGSNNCGTVFSLTPKGTFTILHDFLCSDGSSPNGNMIRANNGNFYGTTYGGGLNNLGTIFEISKSGTFSTLYNFSGKDGQNPWAGLVQAANGDFYGAASGGGLYGSGTVFKVTPAGVLTTLHDFEGPDGATPVGTLIQGSNGQMFGTTQGGGASNAGSVFEVTLQGFVTTLHSFVFNTAAGYWPSCPVIQATNADLYGSVTGDYGSGAMFEIGPGEAFTSIQYAESGPLVQATDGLVYGGVGGGGTGNQGTIFSMSLGLGPFVKTLPAAAAVGSTISILGTNLTGATGVTFNGIPAEFRVISGSSISAIVPSGASSGSVHVFTPQQALASNLSFQVLP